MLPTRRDRRRAWLGAWLQALATSGLVLLVTLAVAERGAWLMTGMALAVGSGAVVAWWASRRIRRRARALRATTPPPVRDVLAERVEPYRALDADGRERFERLLRVFLAETPILGIGCEVGAAERALIAAGAVTPILGFPRWEYATLQRVLVYPDDFSNPIKHPDHPEDPDRRALGMVTEADGLLDGLVMLSLPDIHQGFDAGSPKHNVVIHEFAHLVDRANGRIDGIPAGLREEDRPEWERLVAEAFHHQLRNRDIPAYGFTNEEEFFAVCSEYFFECPQELHGHHEALYRMLTRIYRQDPGRCLNDSEIRA